MADALYPLFQFWDRETPPPEVAELMAGWEADSGFKYRRYNQLSAREFIAEHFDARVLEAYDTCAVPAMQADFFRYAALFVSGGVYVDADIENLGGLDDLLGDAPRGRLMLREERLVANDLMFVRNARDPLMEYAVQRATENVLGMVSNNVWDVTGPGILTHLRVGDSPEKERLFDGFAIEHVNTFKTAVQFHWTMDYKESEEDWRRFEGRSIFADGAEVDPDAARARGRRRAQDLAALFEDRPDGPAVPLPVREQITHVLEEKLDEVLGLVSPTKVIEAGAFEADFSVRARTRFPSAEVMAFEANPRVAEMFLESVRSKGVDYRHTAIGASSGVATIHIPEVIANSDMPYANRMGSLNVVGLRDSKTFPVEVPMETLDAAVGVKDDDRVAVWVDVEGAVDQVLAGADETLARTFVLYCELESSPVWNAQVLDQQIIEILEARGLTMIARDCQKWFQYNAVFARDDLISDPKVSALFDDYAAAARSLWSEAVSAAAAEAPADESDEPDERAASSETSPSPGPAPGRLRRLLSRLSK